MGKPKREEKGSSYTSRRVGKPWGSEGFNPIDQNNYGINPYEPQNLQYLTPKLHVRMCAELVGDIADWGPQWTKPGGDIMQYLHKTKQLITPINTKI